MKRLTILLLLAAVLLGCIGCGARADGDVTVTFFKAGKADAAVVQAGDAVILIDTGLAKNADELIESLETLGVERIDILIVSHFDKDHVGGAADILAHFAVGTVYQSNSPKDSDEYDAYVDALADAGLTAVTVSETVALTVGGVTLAIDGPAEEAYDDDPSNNSSLIVTLTYGGHTVLFAGDAQDARLAEYLADFERPEGDLILKVPYHGHWQDMLPAFLEAAAPDAAVLPCSKSEPEADERARTEAYLESLGAAVYRTFEGDITLTLSENGYRITQ